MRSTNSITRRHRYGVAHPNADPAPGGAAATGEKVVSEPVGGDVRRGSGEPDHGALQRRQFLLRHAPGSRCGSCRRARSAESCGRASTPPGVPSGVLQGNAPAAKPVSVTGPADFSVYTTSSFGTPTVWFDSGNGLPDTRSPAVNTHANWAFEAAGTYTAAFESTATTRAGGAITSGQRSYTFTVRP